jgi:phospholipid/cholesterol/gamma-HCH transport system substrate-binding protein
MESDARYAWVGAGLLGLVILLAGGLYWLLGGADEAVMRRYLVYFQRQSLEGLQINSAVRMQGVNVGKVADYAIMPGEAKRVRVILQVDARTPVLDGIEAVVSRNLVTGLAAIDLNNRPEGGAPLEAVPSGESYPVIKEGVPQLAKVASTLEGLGESGQTTLDRVNQLLSERNQRAVSATLANLEAISGMLRETLPQLNATLASAKLAADRLDTLARDSDLLVRDSQGRIGKVAGEAEVTLVATRDTIKNIDGDVRKLTTQLKRSTDLAMQEVQATAQSLRLAGDALQNAGRSLADPSRVLYGPSKGDLGPGERK